MSMGFCYPGKARSDDKPPKSECVSHWHGTLSNNLLDVRLTVLVGQYAQAHYLRGRRKPTLTETVKAAKDYLPLGHLPLPHPSPRNQPWLAKNLWFEKDVLPIVQTAVRSLAL